MNYQAIKSSIRLIIATVKYDTKDHLPICEEQEIEDMVVGAINVYKPYKRRRLKLDPVSVLRRRLYKMVMRNPQTKRKRDLYQKMYRRKNKRDLERRAEHVEKVKKRLPPAPNQPKPEPKRSSGT
jgi:hypothetical protein